MRRVLLLCLLPVLATAGAGVALAVGETSGTVSVCATATAPGTTTPPHTVAVDGTPVSTVAGASVPDATASQCATTTFTIPTVTQTVTVTTTSPPPSGCDLYASPTGSDSNSGSITSPFATVAKLDSSLTPGQTGCLRAGSYGSTSTLWNPTNSGTSTARITIESYPGESATILGWIAIDASYTTLQNLRIDGSNTFYSGGSCSLSSVSQPLDIEGNYDTLDHVDYSQSVTAKRGNAIGIGFGGAGHGDGTVIRYSRIHDVGQCGDYDHLIYLSHGNGVQVYDNWMWSDSHGWGVQVYPGATNAHIYANVIDAAGSGVVICDAVSGNQVDHNVISGSVGVNNGAGWSAPGAGISGCGPSGSGNSFTTNDVYNNPGGVGSVSNVTISGNITSNPLFVGAASHNYAVQSSSPAASWGLWNGA